MTWKRFFGGHIITQDVPMPVVFNREAHLIDELHHIDARLEELTESMREFQRLNTLRVDNVERFQTDHLTGAQELRAIKHALQSERAKLIKARDQVLDDYSKIRCPRVQ